MAKDKISYVCTSCGYDSPKWLGKCPSCGEWDTFKEFREKKGTKRVLTGSDGFSMSTGSSPVAMSQIQTSDADMAMGRIIEKVKENVLIN